MSVQKKDPAKPGYMSTEFWAMVVYGLHTFGSKLGLSSTDVNDAVSSFSDFFDNLGDNPLETIILGVVIVVYTAIRGYIKKTEILANAQLAITKEKRKLKDEV